MASFGEPCVALDMDTELTVPSPRLPRVRTGVVALGILGALLFGLTGFAHTRAGRPLLALFGKCPVPLPGSLSAKEREEGRALGVSALRGSTPARSRPALMFTVGETTRAEVMAWVAANGIACLLTSSGSTLTCTNVDEKALPEAYRVAPLGKMSLRFDPADRLVVLETTRDGLSAEAAGVAQRTLASELTRSVGAPFRELGDAKDLSGGGTMAQIRTEYRFTNYYASSIASRIGQSIVVYEEYMLIPD